MERCIDLEERGLMTSDGRQAFELGRQTMNK